MRTTTRVALVAALLSGAAVEARAQTPDTGLARWAGREVRFRTGLEQRRGWLVRLDADSFVVREGYGPVAIPRTQLVTLDVRRNTRSAAIAGGILGAVAGGLFGAFAECSSRSSDQPETECTPGEKVAGTVLLASLAGAGGAWYLGHHPGWQRLIPASGVPGAITLVQQAPEPLAPAAPAVPAEVRAEPAQVAGADTPRVAAPAPAPELPASSLVGRWVRVVAGTAGVREGPVVRVDSASLILARDGRPRDTVAVPLASISELWVSMADRPMTGEGLVMGGIVGGVLGVGAGLLGVAAAVRYSPGDPGLIIVAPAIFLASFAFCTATGMLVGGIIGAHTMDRHWQGIATPSRLTLQAVGRGRMAVTLSLRSGGGGRP